MNGDNVNLSNHRKHAWKVALNCGKETAFAVKGRIFSCCCEYKLGNGKRYLKRM